MYSEFVGSSHVLLLLLACFVHILARALFLITDIFTLRKKNCGTGQDYKLISKIHINYRNIHAVMFEQYLPTTDSGFSLYSMYYKKSNVIKTSYDTYTMKSNKLTKN